ncbi:MAG: hypothetical protein V2A64_03570 [Candidatus Omnitrophota bacterium]
MNNQPDNSKINALLAKGGVMFFTIERQVCIYKGMVVLSPLRDNCQRRAVYINKYEYRQLSGEMGGG